MKLVRRSRLAWAGAALVVALGVAACEGAESTSPSSTERVRGVVRTTTAMTAASTTTAAPTTTDASTTTAAPATTAPPTTAPPTTVAPATVVTSIVDGDTFDIGAERIRVIGVDTPERGQPFAAEATDALSLMVLGQAVRLEYDEVTVDQYGRTLAYVWLGDRLVNEELVRMGLAKERFYGDNARYRDRFLLAQLGAATEGLGQWASASAAAPATTLAPVATGGSCDPNYEPCVPVDSDVDCAGGRSNGPSYVAGPVRVIGTDIYDLDGNGDGVGCE